MSEKFGIGLVIGFVFFIFGIFIPRLVLLDVPFGLAFYVAELLGNWRPGPSWVQENRLVSLFCFLVFPFTVSMLFGQATTAVAYRLWNEGRSKSQLYAVIFVLALFALILSVQAQPGVIHVSLFGHWTENY
jgi:hypothetical protein